LDTRGKSSGQYGRNITHGFLIRKKLSFWIFQIYEYKSIDNVFNFNQKQYLLIHRTFVAYHSIFYWCHVQY